FDGYGVWVEHTPITETLFTFLLACALYLTLRAREGSRWLAAAGLAIGVSGTVRPIAFLLIAVVCVWILWAGAGPARRRLLAPLALAAPALAVLIGYVLVQRA